MDVKQWYIQPVGSYTNRLVTELLGQQIEECLCKGERCADKISRDLIKVTVDQLVQCILSSKYSKLTFHIFADAGEGVVSVKLGDIQDHEVSELLTPEHLQVTQADLKVLKRVKKTTGFTHQPGTLPYNARKLRRNEFVLRKSVQGRK